METLIRTQQQYEKMLVRIEELLAIVNNDTSITDKNFIELDLLSDLVADYEALHFPVNIPMLSEVKPSMQKRRIDADMVLA
jgi:HTH-type transcriptional regulator/antitoxin HigA